jgi:hypothetical protein
MQGTESTPSPFDPSVERRLEAVHRRRLRAVWRSAGWPHQDLIEAELLAAGLLERRCEASGHETVRVTEAGVQQLALTLRSNRQRFYAHEALVDRVARHMHRAARLAWTRLSLRAPLERDDGSVDWAVAMPDVFSIRNTTVEDYVEPAVHEIKVRRADLLGDLRRPDKHEAYLALAGECWYVLGEGVGDERDIPSSCGVMVMAQGALQVLRPAPRRAAKVPFTTWMALAKADPWRDEADESQQAL